MAKCGRLWANLTYAGHDEPPLGFWRKSVRGVPLGMTVRKQFGKRLIFQVNRGNGHYGSEKGKRYQVCYKYVVPSSINNPQGEYSRSILRSAVDAWKTKLSEDERNAWRKKALRVKHLTGYNCYVRAVMLGQETP